MIVAYLRVSTDKQFVKNQRFEIERFCEGRGYALDEWIETTTEMPRSVIDRLAPGDTLICKSLLDHSDLLLWSAFVGDRLERGITVVTIDENFVLKDDIGSKVLLGVSAMGKTMADRSKVDTCPHCGGKIN
jgi:DNA invertase Pin-like site-specific DNA recombinase